MSEVPYPVRQALDSDAPLTAELVGLPSRGAGLRRRLDPAWASDARVADAFLAEIQAATRVRAASAFLAPLLDASDGERPFLVRAFAEEGTLRDRLRAGPPLSGGELLTVLEAVLAGLEELAALGFAHGDPSPGNLLLGKTGAPRLADALSCRRVFAEGFAPTADPAGRDRRVVFRWLNAAAEASAPRDPLAGELARALGVAASPEVALLAAWRLASQRGAERRPVARPAPGSALRAGEPPAPVAVRVTLGPFADARIAYQAARAVSDATKEPLADLRRTLETSARTFESRWPEPARGLVEACERQRVPIAVRAAGP